MERKRKTGPAAALPADDERVAKRQKTPDGKSSGSETAETTTEAGLRFIEQLKQARDKNGRPVATAFLSLPDAQELPDYYGQIKLPLAIDTLEAKLRRGEYQTLSILESDVKRLVNNAKAYNEQHSQIFGDAERIRKFTSNWMVKANPAYGDPNYTAVPTPIPVDKNNKRTSTVAQLDGPNTEQLGGVKRLRLRTTLNNVVTTEPDADAAQSLSAPVASDGGVAIGVEAGFEGKTFQEAQEQIMEEMINNPGFIDFINLPHRENKHYYAYFGPANVTSLKRVRDKVQGKHGRNEYTGLTDMKSWDAFENEVKRVWKNAKEYNQDGSVIFNAASALERSFKRRLGEAKRHVSEPPQPNIRLKMAPANSGIKLRLGSQKGSPAPPVDSASQASVQNKTGVSIDQVALQRQKQLVQAGVNGHTSVPSTVPALQQASIFSALPPVAAAEPNGGLKPGQAAAANPQPSQALTNGLPRNTASAMPPPSIIPTATPSSIKPQTSAQSYVPYHAAPTGFDSKWRQGGKDASDALLTSLNIFTHPDLRVARPFRVSVAPHQYLSHQSVTLNLPSKHSYMRFEVMLADGLGTSGGRPYKMFLLVNGMRVQANAIAPGSPSTQKLQYDVKLVQGVNRVEVECVAQTVKAPGSTVTELEVEKCSVFVHLMRT